MTRYPKLMSYLAGDPLCFEDVISRAKTHKAKSCILLTNKNSSNSSDEDYRNILIALAIKKFVYDESAAETKEEERQGSIPLCM
jgi:hypothetical protein